MRVVVTAHQFLPDFSAGTEVIALGIARELQRRGHAVTVVTGHPDTAPRADADRFDRLRYDGIDVERFRHSAHPMGAQRTITELAYDNRLFAKAFDALLARLRPDVVHFVHLARLSASVVAPCVARGIPTVFTATDFWAVCPYSQLRLPDGSVCDGPDANGVNCVRHLAAGFTGRSGAIARVIRRAPDWMLTAGIAMARRSLPLRPALAAEVQALVRRPAFVRARLNQVDRVLAPSQVMASALVAGGIAPERVRLLPYGVAVERIARDVGRGAGPTLRLGFVGSLVEHKGLHVLLDAMRRIDAALPVALHVFGPPGSSPACRAYLAAAEAQARHDPRIRFGGPVDHARIPEVLATIDALVVPSIWRENTPLVVYEAFAAGCPVIASDMDGIAEAVRHEVDGLLFDVGDGDALAACIRRVATDRALLRRLAARTRVPSSVGEHVDALESIYGELLDERAARGARARAPARAPARALAPAS